MKIPSIRIIIPAYNEENSIGLVLKDLPAELLKDVILVDNNSTDSTSDVAMGFGVKVLFEPHRGYGKACLKGLQYLSTEEGKPDIVVFMDADYSDHPDQIYQLIAPVIEQDYDFVIGSRALGNREKGSMMPQQIFGNWLATTLMRELYNYKYSDLGPFRAIKYSKLLALNMQDENFGWTVEMQMKASAKGLKITEIPVSYRRRVGVSKISGTLKGTVKAGWKIIYTILKYHKK